MAIEATAHDERSVTAAIAAAYAAVSDVERRLHPHRQESEIARINACEPGKPVPVDPMTWEVLELAKSVHALSGGIFDPCLPSRPGCLSDLALSAPDDPSKWVLCQVPLALDLGGIAKGYAIDRAIAMLSAAGCHSALVNAGGDLRTYGRCEEILIRHADGHCVPVMFKDEAIAVSELAPSGQRPPEHRGYYVRCPSGRPPRQSAAVCASTAAVADALTKCVLLGEEQCVAHALRALGAREIS
ncbi:MAG: FAD:protein FMN transferase [Gammaproteobacteria bacterium]|nr:FAD:protein FMN transferase [Gammaproteobacteria bacterium]